MLAAHLSRKQIERWTRCGLTTASRGPEPAVRLSLYSLPSGEATCACHSILPFSASHLLDVRPRARFIRSQTLILCRETEVSMEAVGSFTLGHTLALTRATTTSFILTRLRISPGKFQFGRPRVSLLWDSIHDHTGCQTAECQ